MEIKTQITIDDKTYNIIYRDTDPEIEFKGKTIHGAGALCFCGDKIVIGYHAKRNVWELPGGGIDDIETYQQATIREVKEESNMKVLELKYIGCHIYVRADGKEIRNVYSCYIVEPYGNFIAGSDEDITKVELIEPKDVKKYISGWEKIGDEMMKKAFKIKKELSL